MGRSAEVVILCVLSVLCGTAVFPYIAYGRDFPFRVVSRQPRAGQFEHDSPRVPLRFEIDETDLVCEKHEVTLFVAASTNGGGWAVAAQVHVAARRGFSLDQRLGLRVLLVTRCPDLPWYAVYGPFRWRPSSRVRLLSSDAVRTVRVRSAGSQGEPMLLLTPRGTDDTQTERCERYSDGVWECLGVPARVHALALFEGPHGPRWAISAPGRARLQMVTTQDAHWGRVVQLHGPSGTGWSKLRLTVLCQKQPSARSLSVRPVLVQDADSGVYRLGPSTWWIAGFDPPRDRLLELRGSSVATDRVELRRLVAAPPSLPFLLGVVPGTTLKGLVVGTDDQPARHTMVSAFEYQEPSRAVGTTAASPTRRWIADAISDADGRFEIDGLASKRYEFIALHGTLGRAVIDWEVDGRLFLVRLEGTPRLRGRVVSNGYPASGVPVRPLPSRETFEQAVDPITVVAPTVVTADDGQFDVAVPSEGDGQLLIGNATGPRIRVPYPDVSKLGPVVELGDLALPPSTDLLVRFRPGCEVRVAGPVGDLGLTMVEASYDVVSGLYRLRIPEPGLWWVEAV